MEMRKKITARKYAVAFLNLYFDSLDEKLIQPLEDFCRFIKENRGMMCYLNMPEVDHEMQIKLIAELCARFSLPAPFGKLVQVLFSNHHMEILSLVVQKIIKEFLLRTRVFTFQVATSHELSAPDKERIIQFLVKEMSATKIQSTFVVDPTLICGISIRSESVMLEHSIRREIKNFEESLLQRVQE